ncbi:hypothetical protein MFLAVUS_011105 [Mucor flavus]|uniref:Uncharacterized protein n=1 Tax=Mucor flavus TaxID=439312 RepID=A0ABP9ZEQ4_9FUNG
MLCDSEQQFTCPDTVCGDIRFSVCGYNFTGNEDDKVIYNSCSDTSHLDCLGMALTSCFGLRGYVNAFGANDTLPAGNQTVVCERADALHPLPSASTAGIPSASVSSTPTQQSAANVQQANFILAFMFVCLLTVSLSRKF